jgi:phosphate transport system permease protein
VENAIDDTLQEKSPSTLSTQRKYVGDSVARGIFMACAILVIIIIVGVFLFVGISGLSTFSDPHARNFFTSTNWNPQGTPVASFGALGFILGTVVTTIISVLIATPLSFGMALFMTELTPKWLENILRPLLEIFTGMPSVIIGFLAIIVLIPWIGTIAAPLSPYPGEAGSGWATAIIVLIVMILPTIISISIDALRAVPNSVREASLALGSTRWQMMRKAVLPAASTGLATAVVLGMTRGIGEALAVSMVLGGSTNIPQKLFSLGAFFQPNINMTLPIVLYFGNASGTERNSYFLLGFILLVVSFLFVCFSRYLASRSVYR